MIGWLDKLYQIMDRGLLRVLLLILALILAGCIFWDPARFAAKTSSLEIWQGFLLIWAVCAGVIYGVGFRPHSPLWRTFFSPLPAWLIILVGLVFFLVSVK